MWRKPSHFGLQPFPNGNTPLNITNKCNTSHNQRSNSDSSSDSNLLLSDRQKEVLLYCIFPRTSREILEHINVTYQKWNIDKFINTLIDAGLLERTIPNTPNSPNQKYVVKRSRNGWRGWNKAHFSFQEESAIQAKAWIADFSSLYLLFPEKFVKPPISQIASWISKYFVPLRGSKRYVRPNLS